MTMDNAKVLINDKKLNMNDMDSHDVNTNLLNVSSDDELTSLKTGNDVNSEDRKLVIAGLIIENTFTSITDMVIVIVDDFLKSRQEDDGHSDIESGDVPLIDSNSKCGKFMRGLRVFLTWFITNNWNSAARVKEISLPSLYLSGLKDELIPPSQMSKLFGIANKTSVLPVMQTFDEGDHNSTWQRAGQRYWDDISAFSTTTSHMAELVNTA